MLRHELFCRSSKTRRCGENGLRGSLVNFHTIQTPNDSNIDPIAHFVTLAFNQDAKIRLCLLDCNDVASCPKNLLLSGWGLRR